MRHRIFIAINLPEDIKEELSSFREKWPDLPCRWTKKENLHITLAFLGYLRDEELLEISKITEGVASRHKSFLINLKKIIYGPPKQTPERSEGREMSEAQQTPRMVWAEGEKSEELGKLQRDLGNSLAGLSPELENEKGGGYVPHITLGRIRQWEFRQIEPEERPEIDKEISLSFEVNSIEIMESKLKPKGPDYFVLVSVELAKK